MKALTDKAVQFRTYPVIPRKRVKFDPDIAVEIDEYGSENTAFKCLGGFFTHNSYCLLDFFVSHWFEIARRNWTTKFGGQYPTDFFGDIVKNFSVLSPILNMNETRLLDLESDLLGLCQSLRDYVIIDEVSDRTMRLHESLKGISSAALKEIIEKTSCARLKLNYPIRTIKTVKKKQFIGYSTWSNTGDGHSWSKIFDFRIIDEVKGTDGRIVERIYKFGFKSPLGVAMIHNTICGGFWSVNPALYQVSLDAQLLYRYLVITGSRRNNHTADYLAHRLGWREKQRSRIIQRLKIHFEELRDAGLIESYEATENLHHGCLFSFRLQSKRAKKKNAA